LYGFVGNSALNRRDKLGLEVGVGVGVGAGVQIIAGFELSASVVVTSKCRCCITISWTKIKGLGAIAYASVSGVATGSTADLDGYSETHGLMTAAGWGPGGGGAIEATGVYSGGAFGFTATGGKVGPTAGVTIFSARDSGNCTGCAKLYLTGPFCVLVASDRARKCVNENTGLDLPVLGL
jgi:hypothetical protein